MTDINQHLPQLADGENPINPGIVKTVALLRQHGFNTISSGDGETGECECDLGYPYVVVEVSTEAFASEADRLHNLMKARGVEFVSMQDLIDDSNEDYEGENPPLVDKAFVQGDYNVSLGLCQIQLGLVKDGDWEPLPGDVGFNG